MEGNPQMMLGWKEIHKGCWDGRKSTNDIGTRVQILDEPDYISHSTNTLGKGMNPIILPPAIIGFIPSPRVLVLCEMQSVSSRMNLCCRVHFLQ